MSVAQAEQFAVDFPDILTTKNDTEAGSAGFNAVVFRSAEGGLALAIRGTAGVKDLYEDATTIAPYGAAYNQIVEMYNWWQRISSPAGTAVRQFAVVEGLPAAAAPPGSVYLHGYSTPAGDYGTFLVPAAGVPATGGIVADLLAAGAALQVTGHSLGGHLAMAFGSLFDVEGVAAFNAPGFRSDALSANQAFFAALGGSVPAGDRTVNVIGVNDRTEQDSFSPIAGLWSRPGQAVDIAIEDQLSGGEPLGNLPASLNHSLMPLTDALAVYRLLGALDPALTPATFRRIFDLAGNEMYATLERIVDHLRQLLGVDDQPLPAGHDQRDALYGAIQRLQDPLQTPAFDALRGHVCLTPPAELSLEAARSSFATFLSVMTLSPLILEADAAGSDLLQQVQGELYLAYLAGDEAVSDRQLADRLAAFAVQREMFLGDSDHGDRGEPVKFIDREKGVVFDADANGYEGGALSDPAVYDHLRARYVFGSAADDNASDLPGSDNGDHLYGMAGADRLLGAGGGDHLEGGSGDDLLEGGEGDDALFGGDGSDQLSGGPGHDFLRGGAGADRFLWERGDGDDVIVDPDDGGDRIFVDGLDLAGMQFMEVAPASGLYRTASNPDLGLSLEGDTLLLAIGGENGGSLTLAGYGLSGAGAFGIRVEQYRPGAAPRWDRYVTVLGSGPDETDPSAFWRQQSGQGGVDWTATALRFDAAAVTGYTGGDLHGSLGGAFEGGPLGDHLTGDARSNALHGLAGPDLLEGLAGADLLEGGSGSDVLHGGDGADLLFGSARAGLADALDPATSFGQFYLAQIADTPQDSNTLDGGPGNDHLSGGEYDDDMEGGPGVDYLFGGAGRDRLSGGDDRDVLYGDSALHYALEELTTGVAGEKLSIAFAGGAGEASTWRDLLLGGAGDDTLWGELGADTLVGGPGNDALYGDREVDPAWFDAELPAYGQTSPALAALWQGNDLLYGGEGDDLLVGHGGDDQLDGGPGLDRLRGGQGDDSYHFRPGDGLDTIEDDSGLHTLVFHGVDADDLAVSFQGERVLVGTADGDAGFWLDRGQWDAVRIAIGAPGALVERSQLSWRYLDREGNLLLTVAATPGLSEADRASLAVVDDGSARPQVVIGGSAREVVLEGAQDGSGGAVLRVGTAAWQLVMELTAAQLAGGLDFLESPPELALSLLNFYGGIDGTGGADIIVGTGGPDVIEGGAGDDRLEGRGGDDALYGGSGRDIVDGGGGNDRLDGGFGRDTYRFAAGDGDDLLVDPDGAGLIEFAGGVDPASVALYFTGATDSHFRLVYAEGDQVRSEGGMSARSLGDLTVGGAAIPLVLRSDLVDGVLYGTRLDDVFEGGPGDDTLLADGWGRDRFRFSAGDGADVIRVDQQLYPTVAGEIRLAADVDPGTLTFSFSNGDALIGLGGGDRIALDADAVYTFRSNVLGQFTLVSEADPGWIPLIRAEGYVGILPGSYGADHLVGGPYIETILPGYGNDLIEAGGGPDRIVLNDLYMYQGQAGIGHKRIDGGEGNDIVETPLHQGMTFRYQPGDGFDTISYDWSYGSGRPYRFVADAGQDTFRLHPFGQDALAFGAGITLSDLRFVRAGSLLDISLRDGSGGIRIEEFFHAWDPSPGDAMGIDEVFGPDGVPPDTLLHPGLLAAMPRSPIAALRFADGTSYDLVAVLDSYLEISEATLLGTAAADELYGTEGDDIIHALAGDDHIEEAAGSNVIDAGSGDDFLQLAGDNRVDPGPGNDLLNLLGGETRLRFFPGTGHDFVLLDTLQGNLVIELPDTVSLGDLSIGLEPQSVGDALVLSLPASGDSLSVLALGYDAETGTSSADPGSGQIALRFADGLVLAGPELYALAEGTPGELFLGTDRRNVIRGTDGNDILSGGAGKDTLSGRLGDDVYVFGPGGGRDTIKNDDFDLQGRDVLRLTGVDHDEVWLSRDRKHLYLDIVGTDDQVRIDNWFVNEEDVLDAIYAGDRVLLRDQVEQLVNAMAAFDVPDGSGSVIPGEVYTALEPTLTAVWQSAV